MLLGIALSVVGLSATQGTPAEMHREHPEEKPSQETLRLRHRAQAFARRRTRDGGVMVGQG